MRSLNGFLNGWGTFAATTSPEIWILTSRWSRGHRPGSTPPVRGGMRTPAPGGGAAAGAGRGARREAARRAEIAEGRMHKTNATDVHSVISASYDTEWPAGHVSDEQRTENGNRERERNRECATGKKGGVSDRAHGWRVRSPSEGYSDVTDVRGSTANSPPSFRVPIPILCSLFFRKPCRGL